MASGEGFQRGGESMSRMSRSPLSLLGKTPLQPLFFSFRYKTYSPTQWNKGTSNKWC